jgi:predicted ATPase
MMLTRLVLQNFKSIASASIDFSRFTFLVGRNGSGKSNVADALAFVAESTAWPLQTVFNRRGGASSVARRRPLEKGERLSERKVQLGLALEFDTMDTPRMEFPWPTAGRFRYAFQISVSRIGFDVIREQCTIVEPSGKRNWFDREGSRVRSSIEFLNDIGTPFLSTDALLLPFIGGIPDLQLVSSALKSMAVYSIDPGKLREFQDPDTGERLLTDGSNAASVLGEMNPDSRDFRRLFEILAVIVPDLERVRARTMGRKQLLSFIQRWSVDQLLAFDAFNMSDGTLRAFGILLALYQKRRPLLMVVEEPETSLHPAATAAIVDTLRRESETSQIVMTTHSPDVLDYAEPAEQDLKIVAWSEGQTRIGSVAGAAKSALQQHLSSAGELMRMRILDAAPLFEQREEDAQQDLFELL